MPTSATTVLSFSHDLSEANIVIRSPKTNDKWFWWRLLRHIILNTLYIFLTDLTDHQLTRQESLHLESSAPVENVLVDKKAVEKLTEGLLSHYLPDLQNSKRALQELTWVFPFLVFECLMGYWGTAILIGFSRTANNDYVSQLILLSWKWWQIAVTMSQNQRSHASSFFSLKSKDI